MFYLLSLFCYMWGKPPEMRGPFSLTGTSWLCSRSSPGCVWRWGNGFCPKWCFRSFRSYLIRSEWVVTYIQFLSFYPFPVQCKWHHFFLSVIICCILKLKILIAPELGLSSNVSCLSSAPRENKIRVIALSTLVLLLPGSLQQPVGMICRLKRGAQHKDK